MKHNAPVDGLNGRGQCDSSKQKLNMLTALIDCQADTDIPDDNGVTPLHLSVVNSFDEMTRALIHNKADINI